MPRWLASVGMVVTWAVWMLGSAVHYTFLPRCLSRSLGSVVQFAILQAALTGVVSWTTRRGRSDSGKLKQQRLEASDPAGGDATLLLDKPAIAEPSSHQAPGNNGSGPPSSAAPSTLINTYNSGKRNILIAGCAFAVAITMTNASVAYGSVAGSRMVKSLEPAIVAALQLLAGMDSRADFPWVFLLALAVSMMLAVAPTGITLLSAAAALLSTAGISTRNVFVKKHMLAVRAAAGAGAMMATTASSTLAGEEEQASSASATTPAPSPPLPPPALDVQTHLNFVACAVLVALAACARVFVGGGGGGGGVGKADQEDHHITAVSDLAIACASFAAFQVAALMVLERISPTRQAAIKSLQNALTTAWALLIDTTGRGRHNSLEVIPALAWGACVVALASGAQFDAGWRGLPLVSTLGRCLPVRWAWASFGSGKKSLAARKKGEGGEGGGGEGVEVVVLTSSSGTPAATGGTKRGGGGASIEKGTSAARVAWLVVYGTCLAALLLQAAFMALTPRLPLDLGQQHQHHPHVSLGAAGGGNEGAAAAAAVAAAAAAAAAAAPDSASVLTGASAGAIGR